MINDIILYNKNINSSVSCQESNDAIHPQTCINQVLMEHDGVQSLYDWITSNGDKEFSSTLIDWLNTYYPYNTITPIEYQAGENITIANNIISAKIPTIPTPITYTAGNGLKLIGNEFSLNIDIPSSINYTSGCGISINTESPYDISVLIDSKSKGISVSNLGIKGNLIGYDTYGVGKLSINNDLINYTLISNQNINSENYLTQFIGIDENTGRLYSLMPKNRVIPELPSPTEDSYYNLSYTINDGWTWSTSTGTGIVSTDTTKLKIGDSILSSNNNTNSPIEVEAGEGITITSNDNKITISKQSEDSELKYSNKLWSTRIYTENDTINRYYPIATFTNEYTEGNNCGKISFKYSISSTDFSNYQGGFYAEYLFDARVFYSSTGSTLNTPTGRLICINKCKSSETLSLDNMSVITVIPHNDRTATFIVWVKVPSANSGMYVGFDYSIFVDTNNSSMIWYSCKSQDGGKPIYSIDNNRFSAKGLTLPTETNDSKLPISTGSNNIDGNIGSTPIYGILNDNKITSSDGVEYTNTITSIENN